MFWIWDSQSRHIISIANISITVIGFRGRLRSRWVGLGVESGPGMGLGWGNDVSFGNVSDWASPSNKRQENDDVGVTSKRNENGGAAFCEAFPTSLDFVYYYNYAKNGKKDSYRYFGEKCHQTETYFFLPRDLIMNFTTLVYIAHLREKTT